MLPKVSVMVPTYNHRQFISECLDSILNQNYPNLEIVVADDASTDGSQEIIKEYEKKYPAIFKVILAEKNTGVTINCNRAFFACTGKYIAFTSGDDVMESGKLNKQISLMEQHPDCIISHHEIEVFDSRTGKQICYYPGHFSQHLREEGIETIIKCELSTCSIVARRDACPPTGYDVRIPVCSDWLFFIETAARGGKILYIPEVLLRYRRHDNNVSIKIDNTDLLTSIEIVRQKYPHLAEKVKHQKIKLILRQFIKKFLIKSQQIRTIELFLRINFLARGFLNNLSQSRKK